MGFFLTIGLSRELLLCKLEDGVHPVAIDGALLEKSEVGETLELAAQSATPPALNLAEDVRLDFLRSAWFLGAKLVAGDRYHLQIWHGGAPLGKCLCTIASQCIVSSGVLNAAYSIGAGSDSNAMRHACEYEHEYPPRSTPPYGLIRSPR